jgi:phosphoglycerate dehydrogenase-like enzyme
MTARPLVAVSYRAPEDELARITAEVTLAGARVVVLCRLDGTARQAALDEAEVLLGWHPQREIGPDAVAAASHLRLVQLLSAGADQVDYASLPERITVASNVGAYAKPMAEHILAMILALAKRLPRHHAELARGVFRTGAESLAIDGSVAAILGFGGIGKATARLLRPFGARIHAINTSGRTDEPVEFCGTLADLDSVLSEADILVISLPLSLATRRLIGGRELKLMKPAAIMVNAARADIVDQQALYEHLRDVPDFGAGLDVWWHEPSRGRPFRTDYPFFGLPNLIGSPHNSGDVPGIGPAAAGQAAGNVAGYLRGEPLRGVVRRKDYVG